MKVWYCENCGYTEPVLPDDEEKHACRRCGRYMYIQIQRKTPKEKNIKIADRWNE